MKEFLPLLRNRQFLLLWISQLASQITINMLNYLLLIRLYERTNSTIATSFLWVSYALPALLVGPIAAAGVDMFDRRKTLIITNLFQSLVVLLYGLIHKNSLFLLYGLIIIYSLLNQFYVPAEQATLPLLVKKKLLARANTIFFLSVNAAIIFGFGFAGIFLKYLG